MLEVGPADRQRRRDIGDRQLLVVTKVVDQRGGQRADAGRVPCRQDHETSRPACGRADPGEATKVIDWGKLEKALARQLEKPKGEQWALNVVSDFAGEVRSTAQSLLRSDLVEQVRNRTTQLAIDGLENLVEENLIPKVAEVIESERFRRYVVEELLPEARPKIVGWLRRDQLGGVMERFDVRGRVTKAAASMDVDELEAMANRVGAYHLGAIQVLGYLLGLCAGVLMAVATRS